MNQHVPLTQGMNLAGDVITLMNDLLDWQAHIERALRDVSYLYTFNDVVAKVLRQELFMYQFPNCMVLMQVETYPSAKGFHCFIAAGTTEGLLGAEPELTKIGKNLGCTYLSFSGRAGWTRRLKEHGWKQKLIVMHKEIV